MRSIVPKNSYQPTAISYQLFRSCFLFALLIFSFACNSTTAKINQDKNKAALLQANQNIEKFRKGNVNIKIVGANGKTTKLNIKQVSHSFKFGCYLKIDDLAPEKLADYERDFGKLFNFAVVGTYWDFIENKRGVENWNWFEREIALAQKMNLKIEAAPVLWGTNEAGTPKWLPTEKDKLSKILEKHIETILAKSANVEDLEIINEPLAPKSDFFARNAGGDYIEKAFWKARQIAPSKRLMLNEYGVFGAVEKHNYNREKYFDLLRDLLKKNVPIDVVGIQAHANGEWFEPSNIAEELERYAELGKPLQITEFSVQTLNYDDRKTPINILGNYQSGVWNGEKQSEFYREFYTIAFGNPKVEAIVTWGLDDKRAWLPGIGLIDENFQPKPNYEMLNQLINKDWRTDLQIDLAAKDSTEFRGFYGN
ncbi:MAG TPA: endo-1,4-beta-xylanase, partial [Pyrinomonadaceae bacterium]|nr:endo-1,4-beta-xylanase [Pyrinomonadaceae bacterium]